MEPRCATSNIDKFLRHTCPRIEVHLPRTSAELNGGCASSSSLDSSAESSARRGPSSAFFFLRDLWQFYNLPYGLEVPIVSDGTDTSVYFVPYLSAIQLFVSRLAVGEGLQNESSTAALPADGEAGQEAVSENSVPAANLAEKVEKACEFFETAPPDRRLQLPDQIKRLAEICPLVLSGRSSELHPDSWFSIAWYPVLAIPQSLTAARGSFLTYHRFVCGDTADPSAAPFQPFAQLAPQLPLHSYAMPPAQTLDRRPFATPLELGCRLPISTQHLLHPSMYAGDGIQPQVEEHCGLPRSSNEEECASLLKFVPLFEGYVPYKVRMDVWLGQGEDLERNAVLSYVRVENLRKFLSRVGAHHPDFIHCSAFIHDAFGSGSLR